MVDTYLCKLRDTPAARFDRSIPLLYFVRKFLVCDGEGCHAARVSIV